MSNEARKLTNAIIGKFRQGGKIREVLDIYANYLASLIPGDQVTSEENGTFTPPRDGIPSDEVHEIIWKWHKGPVVDRLGDFDLPRLDLHKGKPFLSLACMDGGIKSLVDKLSRLPDWGFDSLNMDNFDELLGEHMQDYEFDWRDVLEGYKIAHENFRREMSVPVMSWSSRSPGEPPGSLYGRRYAHEKPELRPALLPLLKEAASQKIDTKPSKALLDISKKIEAKIKSRLKDPSMLQTFFSVWKDPNWPGRFGNLFVAQLDRTDNLFGSSMHMKTSLVITEVIETDGSSSGLTMRVLWDGHRVHLRKGGQRAWLAARHGGVGYGPATVDGAVKLYLDKIRHLNVEGKPGQAAGPVRDRPFVPDALTMSHLPRYHRDELGFRYDYDDPDYAYWTAPRA
jgi:hypothetical protein